MLFRSEEEDGRDGLELEEFEESLRFRRGESVSWRGGAEDLMRFADD